MALEENGSNGLVMPVAPMYGGGGGFGGNGFGGDGWWILLLFILLGGWNNNGNGGGGFGGGFGGLYPWMNQANLTSEGFQNQLMNDNVTSIRDGVYGISSQLCNGFSDVQMALANGFAGVEQGANARQMANMQSIFGLQSALQNCCCENRAGIADLKYTVATENCQDRYAAAQNTRDIIENANRNNQSILDKLCQLELSAKDDRISDLERQLTMANLATSQTRQTAEIQANILTELRSCPIPTMPVYGQTPIFSCNNNGCGCGCNG